MNQTQASGGGDGQDWVTMADPNEGAFTVQMPRGWQNQAYQVRVSDQPRSVVTSRSPDGGAFLFLGDPNLPVFTAPSGQAFGGNPMMQVHPYVPADAFFRQYVHQRYGQAPGFRVTDGSPDPARERLAYETAQRRGMNVYVTAVSIAFTFIDNGTPVGALLHGLTLSFGAVWLPDVSGILTTGGDPARFDGLLFHMSRSYETNSQWRQQQDNLHAQRMAQIQYDHQSAMSAMQIGHQARMDAIHQFGAANTRAWNERQGQNDALHQSFLQSLLQPHAPVNQSDPSDDASHQRFLNYVKDENTVMDRSGETYQVEAGHDRYFVNKNDNTYIGTDITTEHEDLRSRLGINPDDYEDTRIQR